MQDSIFRMYDIRGIVGSELMLDQVYDLGKALAFYFKHNNFNLKTIALGKDYRSHSTYIHEQLTQAFIDSGISVIDIGLCTTPILYFAEYRLPVQAALMVTASHNPPEYNGIKITQNKKPVAGDEIVVHIKNYYYHKKALNVAEKGTYSSYDVVTEYIDYLVALFPHFKGLNEKFVFNAQNSAAGPVIKKLIQAFKWSHAEVLETEGPMHGAADPTDIAFMKPLFHYIKERDISYGIGFDGDADRMGVIAYDGQLLSGDMLLAAWSRVIANEHKDACVVFDIKCSRSLTQVLLELGLTPIQTPVGHSYIKKAMHQHDALLGGELSGHFNFRDHYFGFDDGIYAALRFIDLIINHKHSIDQIREAFPFRYRSSEIRLAYSGQGATLIKHIKNCFKTEIRFQLNELDGICIETSTGWALVRLSNTQPVVSLRFESTSLQELEYLKNICRQVLEPYVSRKMFDEQVTW